MPDLSEEQVRAVVRAYNRAKGVQTPRRPHPWESAWASYCQMKNNPKKGIDAAESRLSEKFPGMVP